MHQRQYDLVFVDYNLASSRGGLFAIRRLRGLAPQLPVYCLCGNRDPPGLHEREVMSAGATGYLSNDDLLRGIASAIRRHLGPRP